MHLYDCRVGGFTLNAKTGRTADILCDRFIHRLNQLLSLS